MMRRTARRTTRDRGSLNLETVPLLVIMVMMVAIGLAMLGLAISGKASGTDTQAAATQPAPVEQVAAPAEPMSEETKQFLLSTGGIALALVLAGFGGWLLSRGYRAARKRRDAVSGFVPAASVEP